MRPSLSGWWEFCDRGYLSNREPHNGFWFESNASNHSILADHGLGVLGVGAELPEALTRLFAAATNPVLSARIQELYARLGAAIEEAFYWRDRERC